MLFWLIRPFRYLRRALSDNDTPRQLALGFALGIMVGLVPKGNLTAIVLTMALFGSRVNLGTGALAALGFSSIGGLVDPISHVIGQALLGCRPVQWGLGRLFELPLIPWTGLNNTVVLGSLVLGCSQFYFSYRLSQPLFKKYRPKLLEALRRLRRRRAPGQAEVPAQRRAA